MTDLLGVDRLALSEEDRQAQLPASRARVPLARLARALAADWVREHDGARAVGRVKRSPLVQRVLYTPMGAKTPSMEPQDRDWVREQLLNEVLIVERDWGLPLRERWGWAGDRESTGERERGA